MTITVRTRFALCFLSICFTSAVAQSVNLGRGDIPLTVSAAYDANTATPLIVLLHGFGSSGPSQDAYLGISNLADAYGFIFVAPTGNTDPVGTSFWNATPACCDFFNSGVDDSGYIASIIDEIKADYNIDARRVYLIGHSNGGYMSYQVAYDHSNTIAAIVSLAGASHIEERPAPVSPVHILQIHGTADGLVFYAGGANVGNQYPGAMASVTTWANYNGCTSVSTAGEQRDLVVNIDGNETTTLAFQTGCKTGGSAELWTMNGGPHVPAISATFAQQVVEWLYAHAKDEWPSLYSGITPDSSLALEFNNIGSLHAADAVIYTCLRIYSGGLPSSIDGISEFDIGFQLVSAEEGILRITKSRPFNATNALNENNEPPDCSGIFEVTTNIYSDVIQFEAQTLRVNFELTDAATLELTLVSYSELFPP